MLVRVKKTLGNYGHVLNGVIEPKNYASGAFEVSDAKGKELLCRGIVDVVGAVAAPATDAPTEEATQEETPAPALSEMSIKELRAMAKAKGLKGYMTIKKAALIEALTEEATQEETPQFNAAGGVE